MKQTIVVLGMACSVCAANVERKLASLRGVNSVSVSLAGRTALVDFDPTQITLQDMKREVSAIGYDMVIEQDRNIEEIERRQFSLLRRKTLVSWLLSIAVMAVSMGWIGGGSAAQTGFNNQICLILALMNMIYCGRGFYVSALRQLRHLTANMDSLVALEHPRGVPLQQLQHLLGRCLLGSDGHGEPHIFRCLRDDYNLRAHRPLS